MSQQSNSGKLLRRLREVLSESGTAQARLNHTVQVIASETSSEVCSVYLIRDGVLELFATEGLKQEAVHKTVLEIGEGLVGLIAEHARPLALPNASSHPNFAYREETGEEAYHSLMGVPIIRGGRVAGVAVVQSRAQHDYADDDVEVMQTIAMLLAEMVDALLQSAPGARRRRAYGMPQRLTGTVINSGLAQGLAVLHRPRVVVENHLSDDMERERERMKAALKDMRLQIDRMLESTGKEIGESREILETYRMFSQDRGWIRRLVRELEDGLTAEAAVERVQVDNRARMAEISDPYLRERLADLEDLSNRLLRHLSGAGDTVSKERLPKGAILVARNMGPAELLDYDHTRIGALLLQDGSQTSHVAIVARALRIPVMGRLSRLLESIEDGDFIAVDADHGQVFVRPGEDVIVAFTQNLKARDVREAQYAALKDAPAVSLDGVAIGLGINAGLLVDVPHVAATGATGIGLYRTEFQFMVRSTVPRVNQQREIYTTILEQANGRPVVFRTLDVGGDKILPYLTRHEDEENPAMGWRAIRLALDRPGLLRMQFRALILAAGGRTLSLMFPMIAEVAELDQARAMLDREWNRLERMQETLPKKLNVGVMLEVPSLAWQLSSLLPRVDFVSIGSNDLMQFLFASDRGNPHTASRYDILSPAALSLLRDIVERCRSADVNVGLCGEAAGRPLEAMALLGLGLRTISMTADSIGPVKMMIRSLDIAKLRDFMADLYELPDHSLRERLHQFAEDNNVII